MKATTENIQRFCEALTAVTNNSFRRGGDTVNSVEFKPTPGGKKYIRVARYSYCNGTLCPGASAHCFVKVDDGTLWKPAGWKGPERNFPRGSVFDVPETEYAGR